MSKAFTRENDDAPEPVRVRRPASVLPPGVRNHVTPDGRQRWQAELDRLTEEERPRRAASDRPEDRERLGSLDQEIHRLRQLIRSAVATPPPPVGEERIRFGAWVTVRDPSGAETCYRIVGVDEVDLERGWISWLSPLAKALLHRRKGESIRLRTPGGEEALEILAVEYERASE